MEEDYLYKCIIRGASLMFISIIIMEFIGHWFIEGKGSDLTHLLNSIYHTPLYGMYSLFFIKS